MARICPLTDSADLESVHTDISTTENFEYDANGNTIYNHNQEGYRKMYWDESNRLRVVNDNDHQIQHYIYDGAGERILKASSQIETVYENGQVDANTTTMGLYTTYVSPYMVVDANQKYSKHYFNGTQRVASKIGEQDIAIFENGNQYLKQANSKTAENTPSTDFDTLKNKQITDFSYYLSKSTNNATAKNVKVNYTEYKKADTNTETTSAKAADNNSAFAAPQYAEIYYYHSDHLGTGTFLSDFDGNPYQFFLNLPFGETMAEQHSYSGDYTNRYKFNGKELDEETGFYYYGARYYNPKFSIWLSIDPLAEKFSGWNPYNFCLNNPIYFIDPDGMAAVPGDDTYIYKDAQGKVTKTEVINTGTDTPNRLFIQDASATKDTENRKEHNGSFFQIEMIPSNQYTEKDYKSGFFESSQFDKDRHAYITNGGDYSDKNYLQRLGTSLADDPVTISDLTVLLMPRGNAKGPGGALGAEEKAIQYTYAPRVRARGVEDPVSHNFPYSFDKHILQTPAISKNNGYNIYQLPGSMNGKNGVFEIGVNNKNIIDHRFFRPTK